MINFCTLTSRNTYVIIPNIVGTLFLRVNTDNGHTVCLIKRSGPLLRCTTHIDLGILRELEMKYRYASMSTYTFSERGITSSEIGRKGPGFNGRGQKPFLHPRGYFGTLRFPIPYFWFPGSVWADRDRTRASRERSSGWPASTVNAWSSRFAYKLKSWSAAGCFGRFVFKILVCFFSL